MNSSFGIRDALNQAMDSRFRGNDVTSARRFIFTLPVISRHPRESGAGIHFNGPVIPAKAGIHFGQRIPKFES